MLTMMQVEEALADAHVEYELIEHRHTETAGDEARAVGVPAEQVAKTVVLESGGRFVRAVVPASRHVDLAKVRELLGDDDTRLASEAELVLAYPLCELGAVPPFGVPAGDRVLLDRGLAQQESLVLEAGSHRQSVRLKTEDLVRLSHAQFADIATS